MPLGMDKVGYEVKVDTVVSSLMHVLGVEGGGEVVELQLLAALDPGRPVERGLLGVLALERVLVEGVVESRLVHQTVPALGC